MAPAIALTGISFIGCNSVMAVVLLCFAVMLEGTGYAGKFEEYFNSGLLNLKIQPLTFQTMNSLTMNFSIP